MTELFGCNLAKLAKPIILLPQIQNLQDSLHTSICLLFVLLVIRMLCVSVEMAGH